MDLTLSEISAYLRSCNFAPFKLSEADGLCVFQVRREQGDTKSKTYIFYIYSEEETPEGYPKFGQTFTLPTSFKDLEAKAYGATRGLELSLVKR